MGVPHFIWAFGSSVAHRRLVTKRDNHHNGQDRLRAAREQVDLDGDKWQQIFTTLTASQWRRFWNFTKSTQIKDFQVHRWKSTEPSMDPMLLKNKRI